MLVRKSPSGRFLASAVFKIARDNHASLLEFLTMRKEFRLGLLTSVDTNIAAKSIRAMRQHGVRDLQLLGPNIYVG